MNNKSFRTRAAFITAKSAGRWVWVTWTHTEANSHAAILTKASEIGAKAWDFGQADHDFADQARW